MIIFDKLWVTLQKKGISQYKLIHTYGISTGQLDRLKQNGNVTMNTIDILCNILECPICDIADHIKDSNNMFSTP